MTYFFHFFFFVRCAFKATLQLELDSYEGTGIINYCKHTKYFVDDRPTADRNR